MQTLKEFHQYRFVEIEKIDSIGSAYAAGIRQASAEVIALAEDHSYPLPGWGKALIEAHRQPWAAVGPAIGNANSESSVSWADLLIAYSPWLEPNRPTRIDHLPGHNSSYKRSVLLSYGPRLDAFMEAETILHWDLRARGYQLYLEPNAKTQHTNFGLLSSLISAQFYSGRQFGASRADNQSWEFPRKLLYSAALPLIPVVRLRKILKDLKRLPSNRLSIPKVLPLLIFVLIVDAIGQSIGYVFGAGNAPTKLIKLEFHRDQHQKNSER